MNLEIIKNKACIVIQALPIKTLLFISIFIIARFCFAQDALADAEPIVKDTYNGSLKTYMYIGEAVAALMTLIFTRNIKHLGFVAGVAIFFNVVAMLAGV
ncbi:MAG TPA: fimbrial protein [Legionella sp.]|nr:fimbrial protein [Legionella sp.]